MYRGIWKSQEREVAIKKLLQMEKEAHILSVLSHRNIVQFYGAVVDPKCCCLVTEYAPHGSLYSFLQKPEAAELNFSQIIYWARDIAVGISYLHNEAPIKVIHRDLKSKNVVIGSDYTLKICDFGASRFLAETATMTLAGTYPWMAPELIKGKPTGESCDTYSFGVVLWELIIQDIPFRGLEGYQVAINVVEKKERPLLPDCIPEMMHELIDSCWDQNPKDRLSMHEVIHSIDILCEQEQICSEMDTFLANRSQWQVIQRKETDKSIHETEKRVNSDPKEKARMDKQVAIWENNFRSQRRQQTSLMQSSMIIEETSTSFSASFSGNNQEDAVNAIRSIMGGMQQTIADKAQIKGTPLSQLATTEVPGFVPMIDSFARLNYGDVPTSSVKVKASHRRRKSKMSFDPAERPPPVPNSHRQRSSSTKVSEGETAQDRRKSRKNHLYLTAGNGGFGSNNSVSSTVSAPLDSTLPYSA